MADTKKALRKTRKFAHKLLQDKGINCTEYPTKNIVLCNAGQATGLQKEELYRLIQKSLPHITVPKYVPEKGESYSFLLFDSVETAKELHEKCHAKMKLEQKGPPLYMNFVDTVPDRTQIITEPNPTGLTIIENFINEEEEKVLHELFDWHDDSEATGQLKNRQVKHFGYEFRYGSNNVDITAPLDDKIPTQCDFILERLRSYSITLPSKPNQLTVNKYKPGQGIPSHVDKHSPFGGCILSLSLGGSVVMDWKHHGGRYVPVLVPNKSILVMEGEARYDWQHGIQARTWDPRIEYGSRISENGVVEPIKILTEDHEPRNTRISLTFRWTRTGVCECGFPKLCDSRTGNNSLTTNSVAEHLEQLHVHEVYEKIAPHFSTTRHKRWPRVEEFVMRLPAGSVLLDLGSGNGKNIIRNDVLQIAAERSWGLLRECRSRARGVPAADCLRADLLSVPCRAACADGVICIAVIHHFSNRERRIRAIAEIARVLRPGGVALITVWARDQSKAHYLSKSKDGGSSHAGTASTAAGVELPVHENRTQFRHSDLLVPWKLRSGTEALKEKKTLEGKKGTRPFKGTEKITLEDEEKMRTSEEMEGSRTLEGTEKTRTSEETEGTRTLKGAEETLLRYYHVFEEGEMAGLCAEVAGLRVVDSFYEQGNWCVVCEKVD